jgi:SagB-type dehydrogenase family enzyme
MYNDDEIAASETPILFELYHESSKQRRHDLEFNRRIGLVNNSPNIHQVMARAFKSYPGAAFTPLPSVTPGEGLPFERVLALRRSIRRFTGRALHLDALARLVYFADGLSGQLDATDHGVVQPVRMAPSGGALFPIEVYLAVIAVDGLEPGLYHYAVDRHGLELLRPGSFSQQLSEITFDSETFSRAAVVFILTGFFGRSHFKYGERSYRFTLLEAGHICQNILLAAVAQSLGAVAVGGFIDDEVNELLDVDGVEEAAIYMIAAGHPATRPTPTEQGAEELINQLLSALWTGEPVGDNPA